MNRITCYSTLSAATLAFTLLSSPADAALVQYTYTGNPFSYIVPGFSEHLRITIRFTVDEELLPKSGHAILDAHDYSSAQIPFNFSFEQGEGGGTINPATIYPDQSNVDPHFQTYNEWGARIEFNTDANRHLSGDWDANAFLYTYGRPGLLGGTSIGSYSRGLNSLDSIESAQLINSPGIWTRTIVPIPLPGAFLLFVSGLSGLYLNRHLSSRRRYSVFTEA